MQNILIVDDEDKIRRMYTGLLRAENFKVTETSNAIDASEILKRQKIDLILLDVKMPEIDGGVMFDVIELFHKKVKVIVASVYPVDEQKRIITGALDYYDKAQGIDVLLKKIKEAFKNETTEKNTHCR